MVNLINIFFCVNKKSYVIGHMLALNAFRRVITFEVRDVSGSAQGAGCFGVRSCRGCCLMIYLLNIPFVQQKKVMLFDVCSHLTRLEK